MAAVAKATGSVQLPVATGCQSPLSCHADFRANRTRIVFLVVVTWLLGFVVGGYQSNYWSRWVPSPMASVRQAMGFADNVQPQRPVEDPVTNCTFPALDPFDPKIRQFFVQVAPLNCSANSPSLVDLIGTKRLRVNQTKVKAKLASEAVDQCRYRRLQMAPGEDFSVDYGPWSPGFRADVRLDEKDEFLQVECTLEGRVVSRSFHEVVREKPEVERQRRADYRKHVETHTPEETLSVLLLGLDGMSRQNLIRTMPRTRDFLLRRMGAVEYRQFNKVGLNTFPNVFPLLSGLRPEEVKSWHSGLPFDAIDHLFVWNRYRKCGYRTAIQFDNSWMTAFHYLKRGWISPPFDYYPRPVVIASEDDKAYRKTSADCMGDVPEVTHLMDYWLQLASLFNNTRSKPYFAYSFLSHLTHDYQEDASKGDDSYLAFFQELTRRNVLNNTLLIFFSDHGARFGEARHTYNGIFEARAPMLLFVFPPWFERKYRDVMANFRVNADRLTSPFDVHATLQELLTFSGKTRRASRPVLATTTTTRAVSLFTEIPTNRTCRLAGIPVTFCACTAVSRQSLVPSEDTVVLAEQLVKNIVDRTASHRAQCARLAHNETLTVLSMMAEVPLDSRNESLYHVTVRTTPGDGVYEGSVWFRSDTREAKVIGGVSRLNLYRGQAECLDSADVRPYCFCKKEKKKKKKEMVYDVVG